MEKPSTGNPEKLEVLFDGIVVFSTSLFPMDVEHPDRKIPLRACHPNDILSRVAETCRYEGRTPLPEAALLSRACRVDFTEL